MSKKKKNKKEEISEDYFNTWNGSYKKRHIEDLVGALDIPKYYKWCKENGFRPNIKLKTISDIEKEKRHRVRKHSDDILKKQKELRDPKKVLERIFAGDKDLNKHRLNAPYSLIYENYKKLSEEKKDLFKELILHIHKHTNILGDVSLIQGLYNILEWFECKLNHFRDWSPKSYNPRKQFSELLRHIFVKYEVSLYGLCLVASL